MESVEVIVRSLTSLKGKLTISINELEKLARFVETSPSNMGVRDIEKAIEKMDDAKAKIEDRGVDLQTADPENNFENVEVYLAQASAKWLEVRQLALKVVADITNPNPGSLPQPQPQPPSSTFKINESLKPFTLKKGHSPAEYEAWKRKFNVYYTSSKMDRCSLEEQQAYFLACLGPKLSNDLSLKIVDSTPVMGEDGCIDILSYEFERMYPIFSKRVLFHTSDQKKGESRLDWINSLRRSGEHARIHEMSTDDIYVMRIIQGTCDAKLREEILKIESPTLEDVLECARNLEVAENSVAAAAGNFRSNATNTNGTNSKKDKSKSNDPKSQGEKKKCLCCGRSGHIREDCWLKHFTCHNCGKQGHMKQMCRSPPKDTPPKSNPESKTTDAKTG